MTFTGINKFTSIEEFKTYIADKLSKDIDLLLCFDWGMLHEKNPSGSGHVVLIDQISKNLRIIDPSSNSPKWQNWKFENMYNALKEHGDDKMGGIWEFQVFGESAGGIILNENGEVALVRSDRDEFIGFPKGHVEAGETDPKATALREIKEETGIADLRKDDLVYLGEIIRDSFGRADKKKSIKLFTAVTKQLDLESEDENPFWCGLEDVTNKLTTEEDKDFFIRHKPQIAKVFSTFRS
jgi:8-oxo-dGTP pyrophosphatase MutT (NUDIX family)